MAKDRRLTQKQIDRLLANNPHKQPLEIAFEISENKIETHKISFTGSDKDHDTLCAVDQIKNINEFFKNVISRYENNIQRQEEAELMENDIRHCIELAPKLTEKEKKYLYGKLTEILQTRRACKSENEILQPIYDYVKDKMLINKLSQIQGTIANIKDIISNRTYSCRTSVLDDFRTNPLP